MVTLTESSRSANCSGDGRKSSMISTSPRSSSRYLIFGFINLFTFSPVACADDANHTVSIGESNCQNSATHSTKTIEAIFASRAAGEVFSDHAIRIKKSKLRFREALPRVSFDSRRPYLHPTQSSVVPWEKYRLFRGRRPYLCMAISMGTSAINAPKRGAEARSAEASARLARYSVRPPAGTFRLNQQAYRPSKLRVH